MTRTATISITPRATLSAVSDEASPRWRMLFQAMVARFTRGLPLESSQSSSSSGLVWSGLVWSLILASVFGFIPSPRPCGERVRVRGLRFRPHAPIDLVSPRGRRPTRRMLITLSKSLDARGVANGEAKQAAITPVG